jgi:hypothetical protein
MGKGLERTENAVPETGDSYLIHIFGLEVARHIATAVSCQRMFHNKPKDETFIENIEMAKNDFYMALKEFIDKHPTLPAAISVHLPALEELKKKDWSEDETIAEILMIRKEIFNPFRNEISAAA